MGLDFSHCNAHWGYSGFNRFRAKLSEAIGNKSLADFFNAGPSERYKTEVTLEDDEPLNDLLMHSDCDGELTEEQCRVIAPRLREVVSVWADDDYDKMQALELAEGMEDAAANNTSLKFR